MKKIVLVFGLLVSYVFASTVTFNNVPVTLNSDGLNVGDKAPTFYAVDIEFKEAEVGGEKDKVQVIAFIPSLDTAVCRLEAIRFNREIGKMIDVELTIVSKDLPFTQAKFCRDNSIVNVKTVSDYKDDNHVLRYGTTISSPTFLEGLFGRVVYIVNSDGKIAYKQVVKEITLEPNYDEILKALKDIY